MKAKCYSKSAKCTCFTWVTWSSTWVTRDQWRVTWWPRLDMSRYIEAHMWTENGCVLLAYCELETKNCRKQAVKPLFSRILVCCIWGVVFFSVVFILALPDNVSRHHEKKKNGSLPSVVRPSVAGVAIPGRNSLWTSFADFFSILVIACHG